MRRRLNMAATSRRARALEDCAALSAGAIVARAAATAADAGPADTGPSHTGRVAPTFPAGTGLAGTGLAGPTDPPPRRNRSARRRPLRLIGAELRARGAAIGRLALLVALFGFPLWLWQTGRTDAALAAADRGAQWTAETLRSALALRLDRLYVEGRYHTGRRALSSAIGLDRGAALTAIDLAGLRDRLLALPWVGDAIVQRRWPNALHIRLHEHLAIARFDDGGRMRLVSRTGAVVDMGAERDHRDKLLVRGAGAPERTAALVALLQTRPVLARRVVRATRHGRRRWDLAFDNGVFLKLPERRPDAAWHRFADLNRTHGLLARGARGFDMRSRFQFVIRTRQTVIEADSGVARADRNGGRG